MRIAVAYDNGDIGLHFGHAENFAVYDYKDGDVSRCTKTLVPTDGHHGHQAMAELMQAQKVDAVISGNMGGEAKAALLSLGIVPIAGFEGPADLAADLLVLGRLPIGVGENFSGGGCAGSCSGCSGCGPEGCGPDCNCGC